MSKKGKTASAARFGGEFGPYRGENTTGVSLGTFKTLVWVSNLGGLTLVVIGLELLIARQMFGWGLFFCILGVAVALFPSNYEISGMDEEDIPPEENPVQQMVQMNDLVVDLDFLPYPLRVYFSENGVSKCTFVQTKEFLLSESDLSQGEIEVITSVKEWVDSYIAGNFSSPTPILDYQKVTDFRKTIYNNLAKVRPGSKITYAELARLSGSPNASRAVGSAMAANQFVPIIPCHRVVRTDGGLGNYSGLGGIKTKQLLLSFENQASTDVKEDAST